MHTSFRETCSSFYNLQTDHDTEMRNLRQSTSLAKSWEALEVHGCKPWVTNLSIVSHTLGILTANITYCIVLLKYVDESQVSVSVVQFLYLTRVPRSFILANASSLRLPCSTPDVTSGMGISLENRTHKSILLSNGGKKC